METRSLSMILVALIVGCVWYTSHEIQATPTTETHEWNEEHFLQRPTMVAVSVDDDGTEYIPAIRYLDEKSFVVVHAPVGREDGAAYYEREFRPTRDENNVLRRHILKWYIDPE